MPGAEAVLKANIDQARQTLASLASLVEPVQCAADAITEALLGGGKLLACGNGGSAADAAHLTTEFVVRFVQDRRPFPAVCLNAHGGDLTAIGNDYAFDHLFERQVEAFGRAGDVLVALSTSGRSENIRRALSAANDRGLVTVGLLGRDGGPCAGLSRIELLVAGDVTARIQEAHKLLIHTICELVDAHLPRR